MHTPQQLQEIRDALNSLQQQLITLIRDETGATDTVTLDQSAQGRISRIDAIQHQKMAQAQKRRATQRLERVQTILASYDDPDIDFGCCRDCEDPIPMPRLRARPDALFCMECQEARANAR